MIHTSCGLRGGHFLPLHSAGGDVENDGAFEGEAGICCGVDSEALADSGAAVVAGEDDGARGGWFGE